MRRRFNILMRRRRRRRRCNNRVHGLIKPPASVGRLAEERCRRLEVLLHAVAAVTARTQVAPHLL
jgi:hypothetical protein